MPTTSFQEKLLALSALKPGERGRIAFLHYGGGLRQRLLDLGFLPETEVTALWRSPSGDPQAYLVRGTVIALRREEGAQIIVKQKGEEGDLEAAQTFPR
ncbi:MAG TPA: ferrous iron transport protein A [Moorella mulderi]|nr:ferrous iron transport protein A [Moorella mulderi]